jgi:uncharacterized DUF497 family protein
MPPPPRPFRVVYRTFDRIGFNPRKSEEVFAWRGFDLGHIARMFPAYVLEREDTRSYSETRYHVIGEVLGELYVVVYTRSGRACHLITAWNAEYHEREIWYRLMR